MAENEPEEVEQPKQTSSQLANQHIAEPKKQSNALLYLGVIFGTTIVLMIAVVSITVLRPDKDNASLIVSLVGFSATIVAALLALLKSENNATAITELHLAVNTRLTELLKQTSLASVAEGKEKQEKKQITDLNAVSAQVLSGAEEKARVIVDAAQVVARDVLNKTTGEVKDSIAPPKHAPAKVESDPPTEKEQVITVSIGSATEISPNASGTAEIKMSDKG